VDPDILTCSPSAQSLPFTVRGALRNRNVAKAWFVGMHR
jgi:hypothetical protein